MATHGSGCRWQDVGFSVYMNGGQQKKENKCLRCRNWKGKKHKVCEFNDRGYIIIDRRIKK